MRFNGFFSVVLGVIVGSAALVSFDSLSHVNVLNAQVRLLPPVVPNTSAYFVLENDTNSALTLVSASSPVSEKVEIHNHLQENGVMKMVHVPSLTVAAGEKLRLQPGGYHLMLFGLKKPLKKGQTVPINLIAKGGLTIVIEAKVSDAIAKHHH